MRMVPSLVFGMEAEMNTTQQKQIHTILSEGLFLHLRNKCATAINDAVAAMNEKAKKAFSSQANRLMKEFETLKKPFEKQLNVLDKKIEKEEARFKRLLLAHEKILDDFHQEILEVKAARNDAAKKFEARFKDMGIVQSDSLSYRERNHGINCGELYMTNDHPLKLEIFEKAEKLRNEVIMFDEDSEHFLAEIWLADTVEDVRKILNGMKKTRKKMLDFMKKNLAPNSETC